MISPLHDPRHWLDAISNTLHASPLYQELWRHLKADAEILALVDLVDKDQPNLVTFLTAVNFLLLGEPHVPLALYYPHLHPEGGAPPLAKAPLYFREFVLSHQRALRNVLPTARLQTNEVTRCANLLPAFALVSRRGGNQPLHMLEIGCSAGLNLNWFHYGYRYGSIVVGETTSPVSLACELRGERLPPIPAHLPAVARCQGIELVPRDLFNETDMRWVRAAIWPEELQRHQTLDAALLLARQQPAGLPVHQGDACDLLPVLLQAIPEEHTTLIWSSFAINQGPIAVKERINQQIQQASHTRPISRVSLEFEFEEPAGPRLDLFTYRDGAIVTHEILARCAIHGEWMTWLSDTTI